MNLNILTKKKKLKRLVEDVIFHVAPKLMSWRLAETLYIDVMFKKNLIKNQNAYGFTEVEDLDSRRYKEFTILLDADLDYTDLITTIAHEMVHVKQYAKDELRELEDNFRFRKEYFEKSMYYDEEPWEDEAHELEFKLVEDFSQE